MGFGSCALGGCALGLMVCGNMVVLVFGVAGWFDSDWCLVESCLVCWLCDMIAVWCLICFLGMVWWVLVVALWGCALGEFARVLL